MVYVQSCYRIIILKSLILCCAWYYKDNKASIRVGPETRHWETGKCLLYDTTYEHETFNASENEERIVLHVDFFNTLAMTEGEIEILQYIYEMREKFLKAEGVEKVESQVL